MIATLLKIAFAFGDDILYLLVGKFVNKAISIMISAALRKSVDISIFTNEPTFDDLPWKFLFLEG